MTEQTTQAELDRVRRELASCKQAMNHPRVGLFAMRRLLAVYGSLLRQAEQLEVDLACDHVKEPESEKELSSRATVYRHG